MACTCEIRLVEDPRIWDEFVRCAVGGSIFSSSTWLDCAGRVLDLPVRRYGCYKNGVLLAGVSGLEQKRAGLSKLATPVPTPYGGLLCAPLPGTGPTEQESEWAGATHLLTGYLKQHFGHVRLSHTPELCDMREFTWSGWDVIPRFTYHLDLSDLDAQWERVERRTRTVIRKAEKDGFRVVPSTDFCQLRRQYELIFSRRDVSAPVAPDLVQRFAVEVDARGLLDMLRVESSTGETAAMVGFVKGFDTAYAWLPGADPAFQSSGALSLLYWEFLKRTCYQKFDFVGANLASIAKFKRGFGGDLARYFVVERYRNPLIEVAFRTHRRIVRSAGT